MNTDILKTIPAKEWKSQEIQFGVSPSSPIIRFEKIKEFRNICKVTGHPEAMNIELTYEPNNDLIELGSYRKFFEQGFNEYIEKLAVDLYEMFWQKLRPKHLSLRLFLTDKDLTPWSVIVNSNTNWKYNRGN